MHAPQHVQGFPHCQKSLVCPFSLIKFPVAEQTDVRASTSQIIVVKSNLFLISLANNQEITVSAGEDQPAVTAPHWRAVLPAIPLMAL